MDNVIVNKKGTQQRDMAIKPVFNPFPGLRPFTIEESHLFFGREGQSEEILYNLSKNKFVAVIGSSGSGKSSLMYCGVVSTLHGGFIAEAGAKWRVITTKPGDGPIENLAQALVETESEEKLPSSEQNHFVYKKALTASIIRSSSIGLVEAIKQLNYPKDENVLLLVDQFEELFRFKRLKADSTAFNESLIFVKNLLESIQQSEIPIYIVLTMRSDFIGECSQFPELTELINESQYLIPQMKREDYTEAIVGPVAVGGGKISQRLLHQLLNDVGDNPDQLPIMQHALMRTWDYWVKHKIANEPMDIEHYDAIGKMEKALSEHANEAYDELSTRGKETCEILFKSLTEKGADNRGIRRPSPISEIAEIARATEDEVIEVVEKFRAAGRSFLSVSTRDKIHRDSIIDISHESLMRIWGRLKTWVEEESTSVQMYLRLSEAAAMYQQGHTGLWRPPDLELAINWRKKQQPNLAWAQRYDPAFERTMAYLDASEKDYEAEEENKRRLQKKQLRRSRVFAVVLGAAAIVSLGLMFYSFILQKEARTQEQIANNQKKLAEEQKTIAEKESQRAENQREIAIESEDEAIKQKELAEKQKEIAEKEKLNALRSANEALKQKEIADQKTLEAKKQKELATKNAQEAIEQKRIAEEASTRAKNLRMLSIAQSMAVKSLQISNDKHLRGLIAYQAFLFNKEFNGELHNPDIYKGLYFAHAQLIEKAKNLYDAHSNSVVRSIQSDPQNNKLFYSCGFDGKILKWNIDKTEEKHEIIANIPNTNKTMNISPDGNWLACGTRNKGIYLFHTTQYEEKHKILDDQGGSVLSLVFLPNNKELISCNSENSITKWNIEDNSSKVIVNSDERIRSLSISPGGEFMAGASEKGKLFLWDLSTQNPPIILFDMEGNSLYSVQFSNSGELLAAADMQGNVMVWDVATRNLSAMLTSHSARVSDINFSHNDQLIASSSFDKSINIWETADFNKQPVILKDIDSWVWTIAFSKDNKYIYAGYNNGLIKAWYTKSGYIAETMCDLLVRNMSQDEWEAYVAKDIPYRKTCPQIGDK